MSQTHEALGQSLHGITVTHPHRGTTLHIREQCSGVIDHERSLAVFGLTRGRHHPTAKLLNHQLHAVADPQHRDAQIPNRWIAEGSLIGIDRTWASAEDDSTGS